MSVIQWLSSVTLWGLPVTPWIPPIIITIVVVITGLLSLICSAWNSKNKDNNGHPSNLRHEKWFYIWIIELTLLRGTWAFFLPIAINSGFGKDDDGAALRQALIYTTGGVLGVITLGETHRKNTLEKTKNDQDHTRQVHAERRSRYITAIEQLSNSDSATTRLGGVYSLVGLVDEWLADEKTIPNIQERRKKGQVIINNLCAYIRSPFLLAERAEQLDRPYTKDLQKDFKGDKEKFDADKRAFIQEKSALEEERQVRQIIIKEIREHLHNNIEPGPWSDFDYDFSNAHFFYPIGFTNSYFSASSKFSGAIFTQNADFSGVAFAERAPFSKATFTCARFSEATFTKRAPFSEAIFTEYADFSGAQFVDNADFSGAQFVDNADFSGANFFHSASFSGANFFHSASFSETEFDTEPIFVNIQDIQWVKNYKARFSSKTDPEDYNFKVSDYSRCKIETEEQEHNGVKFIIPKDTELFDPDKSYDLEDNEDI